MFIRTSCRRCGRTLTYSPKSAGKAIPCPSCGATMTVPAQQPATAQGASTQQAAASTGAPGEAAPAAWTAATATALAEPPDPVSGAPSVAADPSMASFGMVPPVPEVSEEEMANLPSGGFQLPTAALPTDPPHVQAVGFELWCLDGGVVGGFVLILIAIVWFVIGWWCGYVFFYPPILAVLGIAAIVRGLLSGGPADQF